MKIVIIGVGKCGTRIVERIPKMKGVKKIAILKHPKELGYIPKVDKVISLIRLYRYKDYIVAYYGGVVEIMKIRGPFFRIVDGGYEGIYHVRRLKKLKDKKLKGIVEEMIRKKEMISFPFIDDDPFSAKKINYWICSWSVFPVLWRLRKYYEDGKNSGRET